MRSPFLSTACGDVSFNASEFDDIVADRGAQHKVSQVLQHLNWSVDWTVRENSTVHVVISLEGAHLFVLPRDTLLVNLVRGKNICLSPQYRKMMRSVIGFFTLDELASTIERTHPELNKWKCWRINIS